VATESTLSDLETKIKVDPTTLIQKVHLVDEAGTVITPRKETSIPAGTNWIGKVWVGNGTLTANVLGDRYIHPVLTVLPIKVGFKELKSGKAVVFKGYFEKHFWTDPTTYTVTGTTYTIQTYFTFDAAVNHLFMRLCLHISGYVETAGDKLYVMLKNGRGEILAELLFTETTETTKEVVVSWAVTEPWDGLYIVAKIEATGQVAYITKCVAYQLPIHPVAWGWTYEKEEPFNVKPLRINPVGTLATQYYAAEPSRVVEYFSGLVAAGTGFTKQWSYTVPAGKLCMVEFINAFCDVTDVLNVKAVIGIKSAGYWIEAAAAGLDEWGGELPTKVCRPMKMVLVSGDEVAGFVVNADTVGHHMSVRFMGIEFTDWLA